MILASFSVSTAGVVEFFRQKDDKFGVITNHVNGNITINGTNLTIWYQFPQYGLMGFSEIFVLIAGRYSVFRYSFGTAGSVVPNKQITSQLLAFLKSYFEPVVTTWKSFFFEILVIFSSIVLFY